MKAGDLSVSERAVCEGPASVSTSYSEPLGGIRGSVVLKLHSFSFSFSLFFRIVVKCTPHNSYPFNHFQVYNSVAR